MTRRLRCFCVGTWSWGSWGGSLAGRRHRRWTCLSMTGRHQKRRISRRSGDNDSWMRTGSGRRGGEASTAGRGLGGGGAGGRGWAGVAAGAPCTTSNTGSTPPPTRRQYHVGAPPPSSAPGQRRGQCASGAAGEQRHLYRTCYWPTTSTSTPPMLPHIYLGIPTCLWWLQVCFIIVSLLSLFNEYTTGEIRSNCKAMVGA